MGLSQRDERVGRVLETLATLLPPERPVALHEPQLGAAEQDAVRDCLDSGFVSSVGAYVDRFERELESATGASHAIAVVNGTAALHTCLLLAGVVPGDEVLLPALTFVGTANPVAAMGAIPHFVDSEQGALSVDAAALAAHLDAIGDRSDEGLRNRHTGRRIRALVVVHVLGHIGDMHAVREVCDRFDLQLIEDAAESLGSERDGSHAGCFGALGALSFNGNKLITTGGGGAVLTDDAAVAARARHVTTTAKKPHAWRFDHDEVAYNYRLPNLNAALGVAQLGQLPDLLAAKRRLAQAYSKAFSDVEGVEMFREPTGCRSNHWLNLLWVPDAEHRDALLEAANDRGLLLRPFWTPLHQLPMYVDAPRADLSGAESAFARGVCLPSSAALGDI